AEDAGNRFARLCAGLARLLKDQVAIWSNQKDSDGKDPLLKDGPLKTAVRLYEQAAERASKERDKAQYLVSQGLVYNQLPDPDLKELQRLVKEATSRSSVYAGTIGLRAVTKIREAKLKVDYADKLDILKQADTDLGAALLGCANLDREQR